MRLGSTTSAPAARRSAATLSSTSARLTRSGCPGGVRWSAKRDDEKTLNRIGELYGRVGRVGLVRRVRANGIVAGRMKFLVIAKQKKNVDTFEAVLGELLGLGHEVTLAIQQRDPE